MLACRRLCKFSLTNDDIAIADRLLMKFCERTVELYGSDAATPNMHMHCHLSACIKEFGPIHSSWVFAFERYNGILEGQPTNNRSIELQLMRRFQKDNIHLNLHHEATHWPFADHFLPTLPDLPYESTTSTSLVFNNSVIPGSKYVIASLPTDLLGCLRELYALLYPSLKEQILDGTISLPSMVRKYSTIMWHGKCLKSTLDSNCKNPFIFAVPPFQFSSSAPGEFEGKERLAELNYFVLHTISLPDTAEPTPHLLACTKWPMVHPRRHYFGKPVEVWCTDTYEPMLRNKFFLASNIVARAIIASETICSEHVRVAVPIIE